MICPHVRPMGKTAIQSSWLYQSNNRLCLKTTIELNSSTAEVLVTLAWPFKCHYVLREVWDVHRRPGEHLCVYKAYIINIFIFDWRKKYINILDDMGVSKL